MLSLSVIHMSASVSSEGDQIVQERQEHQEEEEEVWWRDEDGTRQDVKLSQISFPFSFTS